MDVKKTPKKSNPAKKNFSTKKVQLSGMIGTESAKKVVKAPVQIGEAVKDAQVVKDTKKSIKKAQAKTTEFVKGEDVAGETKAPKKIKAKSLRYQRDKVLKEGKKFVYPLQRAKHKIAAISFAIGLAVILATGLVSYLMLYKVQTTSDLFYRLTQIVPFPAGKVNDERVSYEEYLFELNNATYFIENFENVDFSSEQGKQQLEQIKLQVRDKLIENATIRQLAEEYDIEVSDQEIQAKVDEFRRLNGVVEEEEDQNDKLLASIRTTFNWDLDDFERELELQIMKQKIVPFLDQKNKERAEEALAKLEAGEEFKAVAQEYTEDNGTKPTGGEFPQPIDIENIDLPQELVQAGFELDEGEYSGIVQSVFETNEGVNAVALHIVINNKTVDSTSRQLGHILFLYESFDVLAKEELDKAKENSDFYIDFADEAPVEDESEEAASTETEE